MYVQNTAARVVLQVSKFQHITPVLFELHWLPIQYRIIFKILLLVYKSLNGTSPSYLAQKLHYRSHTRSLRSVSNELLMQPGSYTKTYGDRAVVLRNISKTSASVSSGFPNTRKLMKARCRRPSAFIVFECFETPMKHEARVVEMTSTKEN